MIHENTETKFPLCGYINLKKKTIRYRRSVLALKNWVRILKFRFQKNAHTIFLSNKEIKKRGRDVPKQVFLNKKNNQNNYSPKNQNSEICCNMTWVSSESPSPAAPKSSTLYVRSPEGCLHWLGKNAEERVKTKRSRRIIDFFMIDWREYDDWKWKFSFVTGREWIYMGKKI